MHYYPFNIGDHAKDTGHLSLDEEAIYRRLLDLYYTTETPIPDDIESISRLIRARDKCDLIQLILKEFFKLKNGKHFHKRVERELKKYKSKSEKAKQSAKARWHKADSQCERIANAEQTQCETDANQEPLTTKQITKKQQPNINIPFDEFWNVYPNKKGKTGAEKVWLKLTDDEREQALVDCVIRYAHTDKNYIPYGSTYVSRKYWLDELTNDTGPRYETHNRSNTRPESNHAKSIRRNIALAFADDG